MLLLFLHKVTSDIMKESVWSDGLHKIGELYDIVWNYMYNRSACIWLMYIDYSLDELN